MAPTLGCDDPRLGGKAPSRIKPMNVIDRAHLHTGWILAFAQRRGDAWHHGRPDAPDLTGSATVDMAADNGDDPPGVLQNLL